MLGRAFSKAENKCPGLVPTQEGWSRKTHGDVSGQESTDGDDRLTATPSFPLCTSKKDTSAGERCPVPPFSQAVPWVSNGAEGPAPAPRCRHHVLLSHSAPPRFSLLKLEHKDLRREPVLICFTISINYQVNEIPAHSLGTLPRSFRLLTAAGAARMPAARDAWQGTLSLALTSAISPSALFQHRPLEFVLSS